MLRDERAAEPVVSEFFYEGGLVAFVEYLDRAKTAMSEIERRLEGSGREQKLISTVAKRHRDRGVDKLCDLLMREPAKKGGRK